MNTYYKILNEIASVFDTDQWDEQVNLFTNVIDKQLNTFVHNTKYDIIFILENYAGHHDFPQFDFYKERCYVNGEKVHLSFNGVINNDWKDKETVNVMIEDLDQIDSCASMFWGCISLVSVPWFDTSRVTDMSSMFYRCISLVSVPLFDTTGIRPACLTDMFNKCNSLSEETKHEWSSVYDFITDLARR